MVNRHHNITLTSELLWDNPKWLCHDHKMIEWGLCACWVMFFNACLMVFNDNLLFSNDCLMFSNGCIMVFNGHMHIMFSNHHKCLPVVTIYPFQWLPIGNINKFCCCQLQHTSSMIWVKVTLLRCDHLVPETTGHVPITYNWSVRGVTV